MVQQEGTERYLRRQKKLNVKGKMKGECTCIIATDSEPFNLAPPSPGQASCEDHNQAVRTHQHGAGRKLAQAK